MQLHKDFLLFKAYSFEETTKHWTMQIEYVNNVFYTYVLMPFAIHLMIVLMNQTKWLSVLNCLASAIVPHVLLLNVY